jgi:predicted ATPase
MFPVLTGLWNFYLLRADYRSARNLGGDLLDLAQKAQDPALLVAAHWALVESSFWTADFEFARHHIQQVVSLYDFNRDRFLAFIYGQDPWVICRAYDALRLLLLGYPQQALNTIEDILARAHQLEHPFDVGMALFWAAKIHLIRREPLHALERATALAALSEEHGFAFFQPIAGTFRGWALCEQGEIGEGIAEMKIGLTAFRATGTEVYGGFLEALLAEALGRGGKVAEGTNLIHQALSFAASKNERFYEPELYRIKGELLLIEGATVPDVESCFQQAIEIARRQEAKYLELRAVMSLARLWQHYGRPTEAQQILQEIYGWFAEGFDTADLKEARAMLN